MIQARNVSHIYPNGTEAIYDFNITINKGEFVFLVGASGSGKSTIIKLLLKEVEPSKGEIVISDKTITSLKRKEIPYLRRTMGIVFQDFRLLPNKNVYENVSYAMQVIEASKRDIRRNVPMVLSLVGLSRKAKAFPHQLSGGEQQRTALARAIVNAPPLLLCDEPTGNLDPDTAWDIMKLLDDINKRGTTVVIATHAKELVDAMQKRVVAIQNGRVVRDELKGGYHEGGFHDEI